MSQQKALSAAMKAMLKNLAAGRPGTFGLSGRSAFGGAGATALALRRRGLIDGNDNVTYAGRAAIAEQPQKRGRYDR